jgi:hypothetical protein
MQLSIRFSLVALFSRDELGPGQTRLSQYPYEGNEAAICNQRTNSRLQDSLKLIQGTKAIPRLKYFDGVRTKSRIGRNPLWQTNLAKVNSPRSANGIETATPILALCAFKARKRAPLFLSRRSRRSVPPVSARSELAVVLNHARRIP